MLTISLGHWQGVWMKEQDGESEQEVARVEELVKALIKNHLGTHSCENKHTNENIPVFRVEMTVLETRETQKNKKGQKE